MDERAFSSLIGDIYQSPGATENWPRLVSKLARAFDAEHGHLLVFGNPQTVEWGIVKEGADEANIEYARDYAALDRRTQRLFHHPDGRAMSNLDLMTPDEIRRDPVHQDFLPKYDVSHMIAVKCPLDDGRVFLTSVLRGKKSEFDAAAYRWIERLHPHLAHATHLHFELLKARAATESLAAGFDSLPTAIVLLDTAGSVLFANRAARALLDAREGLRLDQGKLSASLSDTRARLDIALACALGKTGTSAATATVIERAGKRPLQLRMLPIPAPIDVLARRAAVIVQINDPERRSEIHPPALAATFGLTPAEARLAAALSAGQNLEAYAEKADLRLHTVRSMLKGIFAKTDTHRQGELIALILRTGRLP
jgi:DNA-binding CsgD family transcriptional regulator/PAS domain-containing protein